MIKTVILAASPLLLSACLFQDPGSQCLNSFKSTLKDPNSGKVISFDAPTLTYTATNSYGARTQGKALCTKVGDEWVRDRHAEYLAVLNLSTEKMKSYNDCRQAGGSDMKCEVNSLEQRLSPNLRLDTDRHLKEAAKELGF
jgi:hypothetical protein